MAPAPSTACLNPCLKDEDFPAPLSTSYNCYASELNEEIFELQPEGHYVFQPEGQPKQSLIDGEYWPPIFLPDCVRSAKAMTPRDDDVFVCTYPKCGTTWIQHICAQLLHDGYGPQVGEGAIPELCKTSPMIERMGAAFAEGIKSPRILKTHFAWYNLPKNPKAKYIYCARNPKDCLTSYYFHNQNFKIYNFASGAFNPFFELFMSDKIAFGNYYWHMHSWLPHVEDKNVLFLRYEDMCANTREAVIKIGNFLGGKAAQRVRNEKILSRILKESKLESMQKDQNRWFPDDNLSGKPFIRKGGSRDWKNYFSLEQSEKIDDQWRKEVVGTIAEKWWKEEMAWDEPEIEIDEGIQEDMFSNGQFSPPREYIVNSQMSKALIMSQPIAIKGRTRFESEGYGSVGSLGSLGSMENTFYMEHSGIPISQSPV